MWSAVRLSMQKEIDHQEDEVLLETPKRDELRELAATLKMGGSRQSWTSRLERHHGSCPPRIHSMT